MMKTNSGRICHAPAIFGIALLASGVPAVAGMFEAFAFGDKLRHEATATVGNHGATGLKPGARGVIEDYLTTYLPTDVTFGTPMLPAIPGGFFGPGSQPFVGQIQLTGEPIDPVTLGPTDTIIRRPMDPVALTDPVGHVGTVPIEIVALNLVSVNPITVNFAGGPPQQWEVRVDLSPSVPSQPIGQITAHKTHPNGGTFDSLIPVIPRFVFVRVNPLPPATQVLDAGAMGIPPFQLSSVGDPWVHILNPALEIITHPGTAWVPGVVETVPGDITSQEPQQFDEVTPDLVTVRHRVCPSQRRFCIYRVSCQQSAFKGACGGADCPVNCGDLCVGAFCVDTCAVSFTNSCGPGCCQEFQWLGDCIVPPAGLPACPVGNPCFCQEQLGTCCDDFGNCSIQAECDCELSGGRFIPNVFNCGPVGACCFGDGTCQEMAEACCINRGGVFLGGVCDPVQACCLDNGICTMAEPDCCTMILGGNPQGFGSVCSPALMPCCLPDGSCQFVDPLCCDDLMGTPLPAGAACDGTLQACCLPGGACQEMDRDCCVQDGGVPQGVGSNCLSADCAGGACEPLPGGGGCTQTGCGCFGECINGGYCDDPACCIDPNDCLCYAPNNQHSIKLCGDCFGECLGGSYCDDPAEPGCWINPAGPACYVPSHPVSAYLCKDCFGRCLANGSYCDGPNPDCCLGGPGTCQCYPPTSPTSLKMCPDVDRCEARCVNYNPFTGQNTVTDCDCVGWHGCHINLPGGTDGRSAAPRGTGNPCIVTDAGGTVTLPPAGCEYLSPDDVHAIIDGLPPGTTIELATIHKDFICHVPGEQNPVCTFPTLVDCDEAGGSLGGEKECSESNLELVMTGTGALAGFNRVLTLPIAFETHTAPRTPGDPVQSFDTDMFRLFGQITNPGSGDPDFDLLRVVAGTDFGLPSPGHTTLTKLPGGPNWAVDSFFDISYRIDFVGRPGGPLGGMSGSTTGTIRMATGAGPECVGECPPGTTCNDTRVVNANGTIDICCDCVEVTGACCLDDGTCINTVPAACPGSFLAGVNCTGTVEACCDPTGISCQMRDPVCCTASGGTPMGPGSNCAGIQTGCCLPGNAIVPPSCIMADPQCCVNAGGTPQPGAQCSGNQACCLSNGSCMDLDPICCDDLGGISQGAGTLCLGDLDGDGQDDACEPGNCGPLVDGSACSQTGCGCFGECINGSYCDAPACCIDPGNCLCYAQNHQVSIKLCGDCFGECLGGSYCDNVANPNCWVNSAGPACYVPNHPVSTYLCKDCFGSCLANGSYCDGPNPDCCLGGPANCQCYSPTDPISLKMCPDVDRCEARCVKYNPFTGQTEVTDCDCVGWHGCHVNLPGGTDGRSVSQRGTGNPCVVTDAGGTVTLPPAGCEYLSPDDVHAIVDGLPPGTTIELATIHKDFICNKQGTINPVCTFSTLVDCDEAGGSLGGEKECVMSTLDMNLTGTGALAGFNRVVVLPIGFETHTAPRTPGDPVQSFDTDMFRLFGQITNPGSGDPDFDLLRIVAGTDFGLPSPGHTTLTKLPGGPNWSIDSFFDITYRIDFVGRPGGPLSGMSGSTTGTIRMATGAGLDCVGECPPGFACNRSDTVNADGTINTCCNCVPQVLDEGCCIMDATGFGCINALPAECIAMGGTPQGPGNLCSTPQACCMPDDRCIMVDPLCCDDIGGTPQGSGMGCHLYGDIEPKQNGDGDVDVDDILKVLDAFADPVSYPNGDIVPCDPLDCTTAAECGADPTGPVCLAVGHCGCVSDADCDLLSPGARCINGRCRIVDVDDVLAILDAFSGFYACPDEPCP